jgi:hypothetical protein
MPEGLWALLLLLCAAADTGRGRGAGTDDEYFLGSGANRPEGSGLCADSLRESLLNDDFCDCADGSDEPGSAACAHVDWHDRAGVPTPTRFACANVGHIPKQLALSRVRDGICDCCDGTDEAAGRCEATCFETGRAWREAREAAERSIRSGLAKRGESLAKLEASVVAARRDVQLRRAELRRVEVLTAGLRAHLALEEVCEYAEQLAVKNDCLLAGMGETRPAGSARQCVPRPLSRVPGLAARSRAIVDSGGGGGADDTSPHVRAILSNRYDVPGGGDGGGDVDGGDEFVVAEAFVEAPVPSAADVRCDYRSHEHLHWSSLMARVLGVALVPARLLWELVRVPFSLLLATPFPAPPAPATTSEGEAGMTDNAAAAATSSSSSSSSSSSIGSSSSSSSSIGSSMAPSATSPLGLARLAGSLLSLPWAMSTLAWVPGMLSPHVDKRHRRTETAMLRQFIAKADEQAAALRRAADRLAELAVLDTAKPDALLFVLGDECFSLQDGEYT